MAQNEFNDFGFTAVDESELNTVRTLSSQAVAGEKKASSLEDCINELHASILPLLKQLKINPEKDYIYWPNRVKKVEDFEKHLLSIINKREI